MSEPKFSSPFPLSKKCSSWLLAAVAEAPELLEVLNVTAHSAMLRWRPPRHFHGDATFFNVSAARLRVRNLDLYFFEAPATHRLTAALAKLAAGGEPPSDEDLAAMAR